MRTESFQKALAATARVACCAALLGLGCEDKDEQDSSDLEEANTDTAQTDSGNEAISVPEDPTFDSCMEAIEAGFAAADFDTSQLLECCLLATEEVGFDDLYNNPEYADLQENCCEEIASQNEFSPACTPWGPPTPPKMMAQLKSRVNVA